ncbi:MAG: D-alanine--D-alanine ligase [Gammaproteobacteria bacterium]|nr:D-alanine--D-alanine ligase [Gammaproteobacteria bacterium]
MKKIHLGLLFGGRSCEHEVSVISARSILQAIDRGKYEVSLIGIDKTGHWHLAENFDALLDDGTVKPLPRIDADDSTVAGNPVTLALHNHGNLSPAGRPAGRGAGCKPLPALDVIFPALHGTFGEDGALQGVFEMAGIPYIGCGVAASAAAMDKSLAKKIFRAAGIPQAPYIDATAEQWRRAPAGIVERSEAQLDWPVFVKPANLGSSIGISKARDRDGLRTAIEFALRFDSKIVIEQSLENCREIECAVIGHAHDAQASTVGEIIPGAEFYDYTTKYLDDKSELVAPAEVPAAVAERVRELSLAAFREIGGDGLARVDFLVARDSGAVTLNEINTMPGFTPISMYPRLWAASGVPYPQLIDRLITLALQTHRAKSRLQREAPSFRAVEK